jgi:hypothetical protein
MAYPEPWIGLTVEGGGRAQSDSKEVGVPGAEFGLSAPDRA